jgi:hypothetical protein
MKKEQQLRDVVADTARAVLIARSYDPEVGCQIAALLSRFDDSLSYEQVLEELKSSESRDAYTVSAIYR